MRRIINILLFLGLVLLPTAAARAQTYQDYTAPIVHTGNGFWYQDQTQNYQYQYSTYDQFYNTNPFETQRYYREHHNVELSVSDNRDPAHPGDAVTYFITVGNPINTTASVDIVAFLDPNTDFRNASNDGQRTGDRVKWNSFVVYGHTKRTLTVTVRVNSDTYDAQQLVFRALADQVSATEVTKVEDYQRRAPMGPTNYNPVVVPIDQAYEVKTLENVPYAQATVRPTDTRERYPDRDLQVAVRTSSQGDDIVYTLTVENHTNRTLKDVDVTHQFHTGVDHVQILSTDGGADRGDRIQWDLGYLAPYEYRVFTYRVNFSGVATVRSSVNAVSRDPALRATVGDTVRVGSSGGMHYAYNYDAVHFPQAGVKDFFSPPEKNEDFLSPAASKDGPLPWAAAISGTFGSLVGMAAMRRFF